MSDKDNSNDTNKPTRALAPVDAFSVSLQKEHQRAIENFFRGDKDRAMKFMSAVRYSLKKTPKLIECDKVSLMNAFMTCAEYELYPSNVSGEAYVLPYGKEAQFQLGYQGVITLLYRAGMQSINADIVCSNDEFDYQSGLNPNLIHRPKVFEDRGNAIGVYAVATLPSGERAFKVLSKEDIMKFKEFSKSKNSDFSPWNPKNDPELSMWRKTAIKQLAKFLPKNSAVFEAIAKDNVDSRISEARALSENSDLKMGNFLKENNNEDDHSQEIEEHEAQIQVEETDSAPRSKKTK